ncbi:MAG: sulfur carrier protein ThiS [Spirochaetales bacterium]|nr:sulfur carrier protein ThiS [Spirochaetales bacterium]
MKTIQLASPGRLFFWGYTMTIVLNGKTEELGEDRTLMDVLSLKHLAEHRVVVEYNGKIIPKNTFSCITLKNNDVLEILHFVGGG